MARTTMRSIFTPAFYPRSTGLLHSVEFLHSLEYANKFMELNLASRKQVSPRPDPDSTNRTLQELASRKHTGPRVEQTPQTDRSQS